MSERETLPALRPAQGEVAPFDMEAVERARATYRRNQISPRSQERYAKAWAAAKAWCKQTGHQALPIHISTVESYTSYLASERKYAASSVDQAVAAIKFAHRMRRALPLDEDGKGLDWKLSDLPAHMKGLRRTISDARQVKRAKPLTDADMRELLDLMRPDHPREALDATVMVLAFAACRRRSEVVGLDWKERSGDAAATGILTADKDGYLLALYKSKTHHDSAVMQYYPILRRDVPRGCAIIDAWLKLAAIKPGTPVVRQIIGTGYDAKAKTGRHPGITHYAKGQRARPYRLRWNGVDQRFATLEAALAARDAAGGIVAPIKAARLDGKRVASIIQRRMFQVLAARELRETGRKKLTPERLAELKAEAALYSGHSGRRGSITEGNRRGLRRDQLLRQSGHKTAAMLDIYIAADEAKDSKFMDGAGL